MTHHAYYVEGPLSLLSEVAAEARATFGFTANNNPSVSVEEWEKFGIDEARELATKASFRDVGGRSLYVIGIAGITSEAQQALLKLFEEPREGVVFVLLVPFGTLMPTLRSRFEKAPFTFAVSETTKDAKAFLALPYKERSAVVTLLLKDDTDAKERVRVFVQQLEHLYHASLKGKMPSPAVAEALRDIGEVREYLADRSPSLKMLLEHLAAVLPKI